MKNKISTFIMLTVFAVTSSFGQNKSTIPFKLAKNYFVNNTFKKSDLTGNKILSAKKFNEIFSMATAMGNAGKPTSIDFTKQFVIVVIYEITDFNTVLIPEKLVKISNNKLNFEFETNIGEKQTMTIRPFIIIIVDKKYKNYNIGLTAHPSGAGISSGAGVPQDHLCQLIQPRLYRGNSIPAVEYLQAKVQ